MATLDALKPGQTSPEASTLDTITAHIAEAMVDAMTLSSLDELTEVGKLLNSSLAMVRERYATVKHAQMQAQRPERVERVKMRCGQCGRTWAGDDYAAAGTVNEAVCGLCKTGQQRPAPVAKPAPIVTEATGEALGVVDGIYTIEFSDGTHSTIKIKTQAEDASFAPGKRVAMYLNGPDNWTNYKGFAFVLSEGNGYHAWKSAPARATAALAVLMSGREAMVNGLKAYGHQSSKCGICSKPLTTPESIKLGIGPICAERIGL